MQNSLQTDVVFLLGAGASVPAGVPDTYAFVNEFQEHIRGKGEEQTLEGVMSILHAHLSDGKVDVEIRHGFSRLAVSPDP